MSLDLTPRQRSLLRQIDAIKAMPGHDRDQLRKLVHQLTEDDDISIELRRDEKRRQGRAGSRSPHFGVWLDDDNDD